MLIMAHYNRNSLVKESSRNGKLLPTIPSPRSVYPSKVTMGTASKSDRLGSNCTARVASKVTESLPYQSTSHWSSDPIKQSSRKSRSNSAKNAIKKSSSSRSSSVQNRGGSRNPDLSSKRSNSTTRATEGLWQGSGTDILSNRSSGVSYSSGYASPQLTRKKALSPGPSSTTKIDKVFTEVGHRVSPSSTRSPVIAWEEGNHKKYTEADSFYSSQSSYYSQDQGSKMMARGDTVGKLSGGGQRNSKKSNGSTVPTYVPNGTAPFSPHKSVTYTGVTQNNNSFKVTVSEEPVTPPAVGSRRKEAVSQPTTSIFTSPISEAWGLHGLRNLGNTCFMNSILQCLSHTPGLTEMFLHPGSLEYSSKSPMKGELAKAYTSLLKEMWSPEASSISVAPTSFKGQIQKYAKRFVGYEQQDCQEFLRFLLAGLHDDLNKPQKKVFDQKSFKSDDDKALYSWEKYLSSECSRISDLFMGQLKSTLKCENCSKDSVTFDPFWDLSLPIPRKSYSNDPEKIQNCLKLFIDKEQLTGMDKAYCNNCKSLQNSQKWFELQRLPLILVLHLKRFAGLRFRSKLDTQIVIPLELDLSPYTVKKEVPEIYCLYAISNHSGTAYGGHYTATCKHVKSKKWFTFNDSQVSPYRAVDYNNTIISSQAYVLFYHRK